jgi:Transcriptional regulator, AbiEi antitoxin
MDAAIAQLAVRQHGLLLRSQVLDLGLTDAMIDYRIRSGRWARVCPGLYRLAGVAVSWRQRALAACLVAGEGSVVSHRSAAVLWGISGFRPGPIEITVPNGHTARSPLARVHRAADVRRAYRDGVPLTPPSRTIVDLAAVVGGQLLEEAVDDVLCRRLCRLDDLVAPAGRRGSRPLHAVLEASKGDALPAGVAEMRVVRRLVEAGLPDPVRQYEIRDSAGGFIARVDLAYPDWRLAIELDGFRWHAGRGPFRSDRLRRNRIEATGWRLLEAAPEDIAPLVEAAAVILREAA